MLAVRRHFRPFVKPDNKSIVLACLLLVLITAANTTLIWLIGWSINKLTGQDFVGLYWTLGVIALVVLLNQGCQFSYFSLLNCLSLRLIARIRQRLLQQVTAVSTAALLRFQKGDLLARLSNDVDRIVTVMLEVPLGFFSHMLVLLVYVTMLFWINVKLAVVALALAPLFYVLQHMIAPRKGRAAQRFYDKNGRLLAYEEQVLNNLQGISSFVAEIQVATTHGERFEQARRWVLKMRNLDVLYNALFAFLTYLCAVVVLAVGVADIEQQVLSVGELVSFVVYLGYLSVPVRGLAQLPIQLQGDHGAAERVWQLMQAEPLVREIAAARPLHISRGEIVFDQLGFCYPGASQTVFSGLDATVKPGETVALVGPSGAGKSTLAKLLMRFYDPDEGVIRVDGQDIRQVSLSSLRQQLAVVWQQPFVVNDTLRANLLLAKPDADEAALRSACEHAQAWEFIERLDQGLDTVLGAGGVELSAGQLQRLSLAQAFLRDAPVLILDEASSALDSASEQKLVSAIEALCAHRTTLIIAHRYASIRNAHRVLYFTGDGTVVSGTHEQLFADHQAYREAVQWQTSLQDA